MRQLILKRIDEIRVQEKGFPTSLMRWQNFSTGIDKTPLKDKNFEAMDDIELLYVFERIIRRTQMQM